MLSDEVMRARTLDAFRQLILKGGRRRPIIFVVEDLHWVDKASEDCLTFLVEHLAASPILFLAIYRPGYRPPWMDKSYATQIALQPLSHQESLELVRSVLPSSPLPERLTRLILDKDRKSTRLNSSHTVISYAVFCLKKKKQHTHHPKHTHYQISPTASKSA